MFSRSLFSSHQLMLFWCIILQAAPQSRLMILARTSLKSFCLFVRSPMAHLAAQGGFSRGLRADLRHPPTTPFTQLPHGRPGPLRLDLKLLALLGWLPQAHFKDCAYTHSNVSSHVYECSLNIVMQYSYIYIQLITYLLLIIYVNTPARSVGTSYTRPFISRILK